MKLSRIAVLLVSLVMIAVSVSVVGSIAYLTDTSSDVNVMSVGNVRITMDEAQVDLNGTPAADGTRTSTGNAYNMVPGHTYTKDPTVTVTADSAPSYVRIKVTLNKLSELKAIFGDTFLPQDYVDGWNSTIWPCAKLTEDPTANTVTYEFRYYQVVEQSAAATPLTPLFTSFTIPGSMTGDQLMTLADSNAEDAIDDSFKIDVVAHAIQATGFADAEQAWQSFDQQTAATAAANKQ